MYHISGELRNTKMIGTLQSQAPFSITFSFLNLSLQVLINVMAISSKFQMCVLMYILTTSKLPRKVLTFFRVCPVHAKAALIPKFQNAIFCWFISRLVSLSCDKEYPPVYFE